MSLVAAVGGNRGGVVVAALDDTKLDELVDLVRCHFDAAGDGFTSANLEFARQQHNNKTLDIAYWYPRGAFGLFTR